MPICLTRSSDCAARRNACRAQGSGSADYKKIIYRLLIGGQGARLTHILASVGDTRRISKAIGHLREHFDEQLKMEDIARELGMSVSAFTTTSSPSPR